MKKRRHSDCCVKLAQIVPMVCVILEDKSLACASVKKDSVVRGARQETQASGMNSL